MLYSDIYLCFKFPYLLGLPFAFLIYIIAIYIIA
jgi:hypothetical protein